MTRVVILGAAGRMGQTLIRCAGRTPGIVLVAAIERKGHPHVGRDAAETAGLPPSGLRIRDEWDASAGADAAIDFTLHDAVPRNVRQAVDLGVAMVIGTTGLNADETSVVREAGFRIPIVWFPNMSLGVGLLLAMARRASQVLGADYRVEIDETHHVHKKDAPSGTALLFGEFVAEARRQDPARVLAHDPEGKERLRDAGKIVIRSHRRGEVVGDHTVAFENEDEKIEFTHHAWNRDAFAVGALRAAQWAATRRPRLYDMLDVLGLSV